MVQDEICSCISTENCTKQHSFSKLMSKNLQGLENIKDLEINASTFSKVNARSKIRNATSDKNKRHFLCQIFYFDREKPKWISERHPMILMVVECKMWKDTTLR